MPTDWLSSPRATVARLPRRNLFPHRPPATVRARPYRSRYTTWAERRTTTVTWVRAAMGEYPPPVSPAVRGEAR